MAQKFRDSQKTKFYKWVSKCVNTTLCTYLHREVVDKIKFYFKRYQVMYTYEVHRGKYLRISHDPMNSSLKISLPNSMNYTPRQIATIIGWGVYSHRESTLKEGFHGPTFCRVWAEVYSDLTNIPISDIVKSMRDSSLKVSNFILKTDADKQIHEVLANRVNELEDAIARGREEFEIFLQPILKELSTAKANLQIFEDNVW